MKTQIKNQPKPSARVARRLMTRQQRLLAEIERYLSKHQELPGRSRQGLRQIESILLKDIEELEVELELATAGS